jgi:hypothetical protein
MTEPAATAREIVVNPHGQRAATRHSGRDVETQAVRADHHESVLDGFLGLFLEGNPLDEDLIDEEIESQHLALHDNV